MTARRLGRALGRLALVSALLVPAGLLAPTMSQAATGPGSWKCDSATLELEQDHVELAPVNPADRAPRGGLVKPVPDPRGKWVPVIMVHGWTSRSTHPNSDGTDNTKGAFSSPIDLTVNKVGHAKGDRSLIGQLQGLPGAAVFTFDYHPYSGRWITDSHLGPALGKVVDCLARASGEKVVIVGHSMGGLIARHAATHVWDGPNGKDIPGDRTGQISRIVTLGTPTTGSIAAMLVAGAVNLGAATNRALAVLRMVLVECGRRTSELIDSSSPCNVIPFVGGFDSKAGQALRYGSEELDKLTPVPRGIYLEALAGDTSFMVPKAGWFATPWETTPVRVGDLVVSLDSATTSATLTHDASCAYQLNYQRGAIDNAGLLITQVAANDVAGQPFGALSGPCFHTSLMRGIELTNEVLGSVGEDLGARYVSRTELLSAPVPSLRGMPAGRLKNGDLNAPGGGLVSLVTKGGGSSALGEFTADGYGDAAAVVGYSPGAGGLDQSVLLYTKRNGQVRLLGEWNTAEADPQGYHGHVTGMVIRNGMVAVRVVTDRSGAIPGREYAVRLRWTESKIQVASVQDMTAQIETVGNDFLQAAANKDTARMKALSTPSAFSAFTSLSPDGVWSYPGRCVVSFPNPPACEVTIVRGRPAPGNWALIFTFDFGTNAAGKTVITKATFTGDAG